MNVVDSSGWIEFLTAGRNGPAFRPVVNAVTDLIVPTICVYEVDRFIRRVQGPTAAATAIDAMKRGRIVDLDARLAVDAAVLGALHRLPMADSIILATARRFDATLWTQDADFADIDGVKYIPKS